MTARAHHRGHPIRWVGHKWIYTGGDPIHMRYGAERPCKACGRVAQKGGPDPCLGRLRNVQAACCGHGVPGEAYIILDNGYDLRGQDAVRLIRCWTQWRVSPPTVLAVFDECYDLELTEAICRAADTISDCPTDLFSYHPEDLIGAARIIEQLRRNSFDFASACDILEEEARKG